MGSTGVYTSIYNVTSRQQEDFQDGKEGHCWRVVNNHNTNLYIYDDADVIHCYKLVNILTSVGYRWG